MALTQVAYSYWKYLEGHSQLSMVQYLLVKIFRRRCRRHHFIERQGRFGWDVFIDHVATLALIM